MYLFEFCLSDENTHIFVLDFLYSLSFFFLPLPIHGSGLPHPWIFHFEISHSVMKYIIALKCLFHPSQ